jgi:hypothetical protein
MKKKLFKYFQFSLIYLICLSNTSFSDELSEIMDSINEVKKEYNNLSSSEITEAKIIDEAVKELNEVVDFSNKTFRSNDIESTVKSLEFTEETLKNISKIASEEISSDMSEVKFDELKDETKKTLIEVTNNIAEKNEVKITSLVNKMSDINDKGLNTFSTTNKLQDLGIETLGSNKLNSELEKTKLELEKSKKEYEEIKKSAPSIINSQGIKDYNSLMSHSLKEIKARDKVKKLTSDIKSIKEKNIIYNIENKPKNYNEFIEKTVNNFDKEILNKKAELQKTKIEYDELKKTTPSIVNSQGIKDLTSHYNHSLKEIQARDKIKKLSSQIDSIKETTEALKNEDIDALKDISNTNPLRGKSILVTNQFGQTQLGVIINSSRGSNVVTYMPSLYGIGSPQTAVLIGNSRVKELVSSINDVKDISKDLKSVSNINELKSEVAKEVTKDVINVVKLETRDFAYNVTKIENEIQEIKDLAKEGGVDLESKAKELGFNSFAEGVEAYNKQNNTSYSVDEAKEALGVK